MLHPEDLKNYQKSAAEFIISTERCALWCEMGLGKTIITLTALIDILRFNPDFRVLIIAPKRVCESVWRQEMTKWSHTKNLSGMLINGNPVQRTKKLESGHAINLISVDLTKWIVEYYQKKWPYDVVIIDEASCFKDSKRQRFKSLKKVIPLSKRVIQLTGTPAPNGLLNIWTQVYLLDQGVRLGRTMTAYKNRYFTSDFMGYNWTIKDGADKEIQGKLKDLALTLSAEDYLNMPRRIDNIINITMGSQTVDIYQELKKELVVELNGEVIEASHVASLVNKLKQLCNGGIYTSGKDGEYQLIHTDKLDWLERIVDEAEGTPVLVGYSFKFDRELILKKFKQAEEIQDEYTVQRWNEGKIPMLICHPASAGHGLNLQHGSNIMVWYGLTWSLEQYQQFNARLYRQGQTKPVIIHHLLMEDSVEQLVMEALNNKHLNQKDLLDAMKRDLQTW
jgi:SNF2 family DNA or RNA helicase